MDQNIQKALWLGVGVMMFIAVVTTGLFLFNKGRSVAEASSEQLDSMSQQLGMVEYTAYDNKKISGDAARSAVQQFKYDSGQFIIVVTTSYPSTTQYISLGTVNGNVLDSVLTDKSLADIDTDIQSMMDKTSDRYINPFGEFLSQLIYDGNDAVVGIRLIQQ